MGQYFATLLVYYIDMTIKELKREFLEYLEIEKGRSILTVRNYDHYLTRFLEYAKVDDPKEVTETQVREYRLWLNRQAGTKVGRNVETLKRKTQNYYLIALRAFLKYLRKRGVESLNPERIELAKVPERSLDLISSAELTRLIEAPDLTTLSGLRDRAILELLFSTGLRVSELCSLPRELDLSRDEFSVRGKGDKVRVVFLSDTAKDAKARISELSKEKTKIERELKEAETQEKSSQEKYEVLKREIEQDKDSGRDAEKAVFKIMSEENELVGKKRILKTEKEKLKLEEEEFKRELEETAHLAGSEVLRFKEAENLQLSAHGQASGNSRPTENSPFFRREQEEKKREIQKLKIRLEDSGAGGSAEVVKEYREASERDEFLRREVEDLEKSAGSLKELIKELENRLSTEFAFGLNRINEEFKNFFKEMFGGGEAKLVLIKEKKIEEIAPTLEEVGAPTLFLRETDVGEEGLDISVNLPRKKIKGLAMLSGGERALASIALIFAISQVNPPPFIILDETDAALDEANSKKYGDMVEKLSKHSQLILITHNRETMSRAGTIYGVTMTSNGASKLLSIAFEEATQIAK